MIAKVFGELPEGILDIIFEFANDGPLRLVFDAKKKRFINKINDNFVSLNKAVQFKIDNPPKTKNP
jgi:Fe-S cluster assembly iron-binding protein IscA